MTKYIVAFFDALLDSEVHGRNRSEAARILTEHDARVNEPGIELFWEETCGDNPACKRSR